MCPQRKRQAFTPDLAPRANSLRLRLLRHGVAGRRYRKEQIGVGRQAGGQGAPLVLGNQQIRELAAGVCHGLSVGRPPAARITRTSQFGMTIVTRLELLRGPGCFCARAPSAKCGGGGAGLEMASAWHGLGSSVTLLAQADGLQGDVNHHALLTHQGTYQARIAGAAIAARAAGQLVEF